MKLYRRYRALQLALSLWDIFAHPRDVNVSLRTALTVGWIVWGN